MGTPFLVTSWRYFISLARFLGVLPCKLARWGFRSAWGGEQQRLWQPRPWSITLDKPDVFVLRLSTAWESYSLAMMVVILTPVLLAACYWPCAMYMRGQLTLGHFTIIHATATVQLLQACSVFAVQIVTFLKRKELLLALSRVSMYGQLYPSHKLSSFLRTTFSRIILAQYILAFIYPTVGVIWEHAKGPLDWDVNLAKSFAELLGHIFLLNIDYLLTNQVLALSIETTNIGNSLSQASAMEQHLREFVADLRTRYDFLFGIFSLLNEVFSKVMLFTTSLMFAEVLLTSYIVTYFHFHISTTLPQTLWIVMFIAKICLVNMSLERLKNSPAVTKDAVQDILSRADVPPETREELKSFFIQLELLPMQFSACGFFPLDHTQLQGIIAAITTYLVILVQM